MLVTKELVEERRRLYMNKMVEFVATSGPDPSPLEPGDQGLVTFVDSVGTLSVSWNSGRRLGVVVEDSVRIIG